MKEWIEQYFSSSIEYENNNILDLWMNNNFNTINFINIINQWFNNFDYINHNKIISNKKQIKKDYPPFFTTFFYLKQTKLNYNFFIFNFLIMNKKNRIELLNYYINENKRIEAHFILNFRNLINDKIIINKDDNNFIYFNINNQTFHNELGIKYFIQNTDFIENNIIIIKE